MIWFLNVVFGRRKESYEWWRKLPPLLALYFNFTEAFKDVDWRKKLMQNSWVLFPVLFFIYKIFHIYIPFLYRISFICIINYFY